MRYERIWPCASSLLVDFAAAADDFVVDDDVASEVRSATSLARAV